MNNNQQPNESIIEFAKAIKIICASVQNASISISDFATAIRNGLTEKQIINYYHKENKLRRYLRRMARQQGKDWIHIK